jgi:hypothetical protein
VKRIPCSELRKKVYGSNLHSNKSRAGTLLIVVVGISALFMSISLVFLVNMRSDAAESATLMREAQARLVLIGGLQYIQEASRLGWERLDSNNKETPEHEEAFGWTDVRDGSAGPKDKDGIPLYDVTSDKFPVIGGKAARFELYVMEQPPFAIKPTFAHNPVPLQPTLAWKDLVNYKTPDPQPVAPNWQEFKDGKPRPRMATVNKAWMRIYRDKNTPVDPANPTSLTNFVEPATFTITCGAGATLGYRTYDEAKAEGADELFLKDRNYFAELRQQERILWFRTEWTSAVGGSGMGVRMKDGYWELPEINKGAYKDVYQGTPLAGTKHQWWVNRNAVGSFLWIQRLENEPNNW